MGLTLGAIMGVMCKFRITHRRERTRFLAINMEIE